MESPVPDRIEKQVILKAPLERVWRAISNAEEFGSWFGIDFSGQEFRPGEVVSVKMTEPPEFAGMDFTIGVVEIKPPAYISFEWHPYGIEPGIDYSGEAMTLIEFTLEEDGSGTILRVVESGFERIPAERRPLAFRMNSDGWEEQVERIRKHLDG